MTYQKEVPDKLYFKIGEVSDIAGVPAYVLRFWETEFKTINPKRTSAGQRQYRKSDVELILTIKHLLYDKKYTIEGAKRHLRFLKREKSQTLISEELEIIRQELKTIRDLLGRP